jgi:hypothetical protein
MPMKVSVDGSRFHTWVLVARRSPLAEEEVGAKFERVGAHPVAMASSGLSRAERGVCTENLIRVDDVMESPKLAE